MMVQLMESQRTYSYGGLALSVKVFHHDMMGGRGRQNKHRRTRKFITGDMKRRQVDKIGNQLF